MSELKEKRDQLFKDLWAGKRPERVPITFSAGQDFAISYFGYDPKVDMYNIPLTYEMADKMAQLVPGDVLPMGAGSPAAIYRYEKALFMTVGSDGFFQHPDIAPMTVEEYPELIADPLKFIVEKIHPRVFGLIADDPEYGQLRVNIARQVIGKMYQGLGPNLAQKYDRSDVQSQAIILWAPLDFIADYIRSFSTILTDIRRYPQYVIDSCEAVCDYEIEQAKNLPTPNTNGKITFISMPLHMAPFMRTKDVAKFYFPSYKRVVAGFQDLGFHVQTHAEQDWTPHLEIISDLPGRCFIKFEDAHPSEVVKRVSTQHIFGNMYPNNLLKFGTKQENIDKAKEYLDILMPAGNYVFSPNKGPLRKYDLNLENVNALAEFISEYGVYK